MSQNVNPSVQLVLKSLLRYVQAFSYLLFHDTSGSGTLLRSLRVRLSANGLKHIVSYICTLFI